MRSGRWHTSTASSARARRWTADSVSPRWWKSPRKERLPSNFYINGRYILQPEIFSILAKQERGAGNEIQVTDAMLKLAEEQPFSAYTFGGETYDCGSKAGFILANVAFALDREDIKPDVAAELKALIARA
jgi:UTP--glucose-1-phosphate uridylyltransferase